jgi:hypothetical protein
MYLTPMATVYVIDGSGDFTYGVVIENAGGSVRIQWETGMVQTLKHHEMLCIYIGGK